jgi:hypothetical protein
LIALRKRWQTNRESAQRGPDVPGHGVRYVLEHFPNTRAVLRFVQGVFSLRKKTLDIQFSLYSNWENTIAIVSPIEMEKASVNKGEEGSLFAP